MIQTSVFIHENQTHVVHQGAGVRSEDWHTEAPDQVPLVPRPSCLSPWLLVPGALGPETNGERKTQEDTFLLMFQANTHIQYHTRGNRSLPGVLMLVIARMWTSCTWLVWWSCWWFPCGNVDVDILHCPTILNGPLAPGLAGDSERSGVEALWSAHSSFFLSWIRRKWFGVGFVFTWTSSFSHLFLSFYLSVYKKKE